MTIAAVVKSIYSATEHSHGLPRPPVEKLECIEGHGIKDDKFAGGNLERTVMIVGYKAYNIAKEAGIQLQYGSLGENILLDLNPHDLDIESRLRIGDAVLEIAASCSICKHLAQYDNRLPQLIHGHRGVYCKIIQSGTIKKGDKVLLLTKEEVA